MWNATAPGGHETFLRGQHEQYVASQLMAKRSVFHMTHLTGEKWAKDLLTFC